MFILAAAFLLLLLASDFLGLVMLLASIALLFSTTWRRTAGIAIGVGLLGAGLAASMLVLFKWASGMAVIWEAWLMFAAAGFGWASVLAVGITTLRALLRQPARWVERKKTHL